LSFINGSKAEVDQPAVTRMRNMNQPLRQMPAVRPGEAFGDSVPKAVLRSTALTPPEAGQLPLPLGISLPGTSHELQRASIGQTITFYGQRRSPEKIAVSSFCKVVLVAVSQFVNG